MIDIILEDEHGKPIKKVEGLTYLLGQFLPAHDDETSQCLRFIDPYGDTVFNRLQIKQFLAEWEKVASKAKTDEEKQLVDQVKYLAERCHREPHLYLKFYGD